MAFEAIVLALFNAARPTGLAAIYELLSAPQPRRLLIAYIAVGFAWSVLVGTIVVEALHGVTVNTGTSTATSIIDLAGGVVALGFALRRVVAPRPRPERRGPSEEETRMARALHDPSLAIAAGAGVATHLPGLFYLLGLNAIAATKPGVVEGAVDVVIFNVIWFSAPIASLVLSIRRPELAQQALSAVNEVIHRHEDQAITAVLALVGAYFVVKGFFDLLS